MPLSKFNSDEYVAHYTSFDTVVKYILPSNKIRVSSAELLNDPYENNVDWLDVEENYKEISPHECYQNSLYLNKIKNKIKRNIKIFSTTSFDVNSKKTADISNDIYCRPRMWAQYGDNHQGICLIFDKKELHTEFDCYRKVALISKKVEYENFIPIINNDVSVEPSVLESLSNDAYKLYKELNKNQQLTSRFLKKHSDWESEHEYRWILFAEDDSELFLDFHNSLKAIVFGSKVHDNYKNCFNKYNIPKYDLFFNNGNYMAKKLLNNFDCYYKQYDKTNIEEL